MRIIRDAPWIKEAETVGYPVSKRTVDEDDGEEEEDEDEENETFCEL